MKMYEENKEDFQAYLEEMCEQLKRIWEHFVENYNILVEDLNSLEWNIFRQEEWQDEQGIYIINISYNLYSCILYQRKKRQKSVASYKG